MSLKKIVSVVAIGAGIGTAIGITLAKYSTRRFIEECKKESDSFNEQFEQFNKSIDMLIQQTEKEISKAEELGLPILVFKTKKKAEEVLSALHDELAKTGIANASTMYKEAGVQHIPEEAATVHWRDLTGAKVSKLDDKKWLITFPDGKE